MRCRCTTFENSGIQWKHVERDWRLKIMFTKMNLALSTWNLLNGSNFFDRKTIAARVGGILVENTKVVGEAQQLLENPRGRKLV